MTTTNNSGGNGKDRLTASLSNRVQPFDRAAAVQPSPSGDTCPNCGNDTLHLSYGEMHCAFPTCDYGESRDDEQNYGARIRRCDVKLRISWLRYLRTYGWLTTLLLDARMFPLRGRQYPVMPAEGR